MKKSIFTLTILAFSICMALGCDQKTAEWPADPGGSGSACGAYYPGFQDADAGTEETESLYGIAEGDIFTCAVWESVRLAGEDTYLNIGEEHLKVKNGLSDKKALVIPVTATS